MAASATLALKAGVWFRRGRLFIVSPDSLAQRARCQAETPLIVLFRFLRPALSWLFESGNAKFLRIKSQCVGRAREGIRDGSRAINVFRPIMPPLVFAQPSCPERGPD